MALTAAVLALAKLSAVSYSSIINAASRSTVHATIGSSVHVTTRSPVYAAAIAIDKCCCGWK